MPDDRPVEPDADPATTPPAPGDPERAADLADAALVRRVRRRLVLWSGGITLAVLVVLGAVLYLAVDRSLAATGTATLVSTADLLTGGRPDPEDVPTGGLRFGGPGSGTFTLVSNGDGQTLLGAGPGPDRVPDGLPLMAGIQAVQSGGQRDVRNAVVAVDTPVRVLTQAVLIRGTPAYLQVVGDRTTEVRTLSVLVVVLVVGGIVALLVALAVGAVYAERALVPIRDSLAGQRSALRRQRDFAADASHELRTPLTVIRSSVEHLDRHRDEPVATVGTALDDIDAEVRHMTSIVEDLLLLARSDSGAVELEQVPVDLGDVVTDGASSLAQPASDRGVEVVVDPRPVVVRGDPVRLRQLVMILVDNAIRHSPERGTVRVSLAPDPSGTTLIVEDEGPGIPVEDLPHVFERFYRSPGAPSGGTGLGLAIAAWIVERHGGRIAVANRPTGGASFRVVLPATA